MTPTFTPAGPADADGLLEMMARLYRHLRTPFEVAEARLVLAGLLGNPDFGRVWVIRRGAEPIGYVAVTTGFSLEFGGLFAALDELFVEEPDRGQGVGRQALAVAEEYCRSAGLKALVLEVNRADERARRFYAQAGFADRGHMLLVKRV
jgi:GNAT superfamily N-acetyltransferase